LVLADAARVRFLQLLRKEALDVSMMSSYCGPWSFSFGRASVCVMTSAAPVAAQISATSGLMRPLGSFTIEAPASIAARATAGL